MGLHLDSRLNDTDYTRIRRCAAAGPRCPPPTETVQAIPHSASGKFEQWITQVKHTWRKVRKRINHGQCRKGHEHSTG